MNTWLKILLIIFLIISIILNIILYSYNSYLNDYNKDCYNAYNQFDGKWTARYKQLLDCEIDGSKKCEVDMALINEEYE